MFGIAMGLFEWIAMEPIAAQGFIDMVDTIRRYALISIFGSIPMIWVSWGVLLRREWARKGMVALIAIAVIAHIALVPTLQKSFALAGDLPADSLPGMIIGFMKWLAYGGLAFATLVMIWLGRKLTLSPVKDEFS